MDVKSAASVLDAVKAPSNTRLKIIAMVTEKKESKQRTVLTVEDLKASAIVLIPQNASQDLQKKVRAPSTPARPSHLPQRRQDQKQPALLLKT